MADSTLDDTLTDPLTDPQITPAASAEAPAGQFGGVPSLPADPRFMRTGPDPYLAREGIAGVRSAIRRGEALPEDTGLFSEYAKGVKNWLRQTGTGLAATAGSLVPGKGPMDTLARNRMEEEAFRGETRPAEGFWNYGMNLLGQGTMEIGSFAIPQYGAAKVATSIAKAGAGATMLSKIQQTERAARAARMIGGAQKATMATVIASRGHGVNYYDYLDKTGNPFVAHLAAAVSDILEYKVERIGGPQLIAERKTIDHMLRGLFSAADATPEVGGLLQRMARGAVKSKPYGYVRSVLNNVTAETAEEMASQLGNAALKAVVTGNTDLTWKEFWKSTIDSFGVALPGALLFGSAQAHRQQTQEKVIRELVKKPDVVDDPALGMVNELGRVMRGLGASDEEANRWGEVIYNVAVNLSQIDEAGMKPQQFFEGLSVAMLRDKKVDFAKLRELKDSAEKTIDYLRTVFPDLNERIYSLTDGVTAEGARRENAAIAKENAKLGGKWYSEDGSTLATGLAKFLEGTEIPAEGVAVYVDFSAPGTDLTFWRNVYAQGIVHNIALNGKTYSLRMFDDGSMHVRERAPTVPDDTWNPVVVETVKSRRLRTYANRFEMADDIIAHAKPSGGRATEAVFEAAKATGARLLPASATSIAAKLQARGKPAEAPQGPFAALGGGVADTGERNPFLEMPIDRVNEAAKQGNAAAVEAMRALVGEDEYGRMTEEGKPTLSKKALDALRTEKPELFEQRQPQVPDTTTAEQGVRLTMAAADKQRPRGGWFSARGSGLRAQYLPSRKVALFYENAIPEDVAHEWLHHIIGENLLPQRHLDILLKNYRGSDAKPLDEEQVVNAFLAYVKDGALPADPKLVETMDYLSDVLAQSYLATRGVLNADTEAMFAEWFGKRTPKPEQQATGDAVVEAAEEASEARDESVKFSFAGREADTADIGQADRAEQMERERITPDMPLAEKEVVWRQIAQETGWHRVVDGEKMMFEIDDSRGTIKVQDFRTAKLGDVLDHPQLYEAYPQMRDVTVVRDKGDTRWDASRNTIFIDENVAVTSRDFQADLSHEVQHGIGDIEGFKVGTSPDSDTARTATYNSREIREDGSSVGGAWPPEPDDVHRTYMRFTGEALARLVSDRLDMTPEQRRAESPRDMLKKMLASEGLLQEGQQPEDVLISRGGGGVAQMDRGVRFSSAPERSTANSKIHAIFGNHPAAKRAASDKFGVDSMEDLTDEQMQQWADELGTQQSAKKAELAEYLYGESFEDVQRDPEKLENVNRAFRWAMQNPGGRRRSQRKQKAHVEVSQERKDALVRDSQTRPAAPALIAKAHGGDIEHAAAMNRWEQVKRGVRKLRYGILRGMVRDQFTDVRTNIDMLADGDMNSPWITDVYARWQDMTRDSTKVHWELAKWWQDAVQRIGPFDTNLGARMDLNGIQRTRNDVLFLALIGRGDPKRQEAEALYAANPEFSIGPDGQQSREIFDANLRAAYKAARADAGLDTTIKLLEEFYAYIYPRLDAVHQELHKSPLGKVDFYFPMIREGGMFLDSDWLGQVAGITPQKQGEQQAKREAYGFTKERSLKRVEQRFATNVAQVFANYKAQAIIYLAKQATILEIGQLLENPELRSDTIRRFTNDEPLRLMWELLNRERFSTGRTEPMTKDEAILRTIRASAVQGQLALNLNNALVQAMSLVSWGGEVDTKTFMSGAMRLLHNIVYGSAHLNQLRDTRGHLNLFDGDPTWELMKKSGSKETLASFDITDIDISEALSDSISNKNVQGLPIRDWLYMGQRLVDQSTRIAAWGATYSAEHQRWLDQGKSEEFAHDKAFRAAEDAVGATQAGTAMMERTRSQTGSERLRILMPYTSELLKRFNYARSKIIRPLFRAWESTKGYPAPQRWEKVAQTLFKPGGNEFTNRAVGRKVFFQYVAPVLAFGILARGRLPEDWEEFCFDFVGHNIQIIPIIGPAISLYWLYEGWTKGNSPMYLQWVDELAKTVRKTVEADDEKNWAELGSSVIYATRFAGVPASIVRIPKKILQWQETDPPIMRAAVDVMMNWKTDEKTMREALEGFDFSRWSAEE